MPRSAGQWEPAAGPRGAVWARVSGPPPPLGAGGRWGSGPGAARSAAGVHGLGQAGLTRKLLPLPAPFSPLTLVVEGDRPFGGSTHPRPHPPQARARAQTHTHARTHTLRGEEGGLPTGPRRSRRHPFIMKETQMRKAGLYIHPFDKCLLSTYCVPSAGNAAGK